MRVLDRFCRARQGLVLGTVLLVGCAGPRSELKIPDVRQATNYTCGAAALQGVLAYYGMDRREDVLARELSADPDKGVNPPAIMKVAQAHGLKAELREEMSLADLETVLRAGSPVIVALQAWADKPKANYQEDWDDGHYAVVVAVDKEQVIFEDPSVLGSRAVLSRAEFLDRWHDTDGKKRYTRMGIIFSGKPAAARPRRVRME